MMSPPISSLTNNNANKNTTSGAQQTTTTHITSSSNSLNSNSTSLQQQQQYQQLNQEQQPISVYMVPTVLNSFSYSQNAIRKRKVKFTVIFMSTLNIINSKLNHNFIIDST